jgi:shikimate kinase
VADASARHIVLVGAMGCGKSTIGRPLAAALGRTFVDNDTRLEQRTGETAAGLADAEGVDALHRAEAATLLDALRTRPPAVIAAAASTIEDPDVRAALRDSAWVAWLRADPATLAARWPGSTVRPFADADPLRLVAEQARRRDGWFESVADAQFSTDRADPDHVVTDVLAALPYGDKPDAGVRMD